MIVPMQGSRVNENDQAIEQSGVEKKPWVTPKLEELNCKETATGLLVGGEIIVLLRHS